MLTGEDRRWIIPISEIELGESSILGNNYLVFYTIHITSLVIVFISILSCISVLISVILNSKSSKSGNEYNAAVGGFTKRFPIYLAIADALWGLSHSLDHTYLLVYHKYPEKPLSTFLSLNCWVGLG